MIEPLTQEELTGLDDDQFAERQRLMLIEATEKYRAIQLSDGEDSDEAETDGEDAEPTDELSEMQIRLLERDPLLRAEGAIVFQEMQDLVRKWHPEYTDEQVEARAGRITHEAFNRQRRHFDREFNQACSQIGSPTKFPNYNDYMQAVEFLYMDTGAAQMFGERLGNTVTDIAKRCKKAEDGSHAKDQLIDSLRDEIAELTHAIGKLRGNKNR